MSSETIQRDGYKIRDRRVSRNGAPSPSSIAGGLYATPRNSSQTNFYRPRINTGDLHDLLEEYDWSEILNFSRQIFAQLGNVGSAIVQRSAYAFGDAWKPTFIGENQAWGDTVEPWLRDEWFPNCDIRGGVFDFNKDLELSGIAEDVDGHDCVAFAVREDGWPLLKFYGAHEIGSRGTKDEAKGGSLDGAAIHNGIIVDRDKRFLGVKILGEKVEDDQIIPAQNCHLHFDPEWHHQMYGIPKVARVLLDCFDTQDIDVFLKRGVKLDASIGILHWTQSGQAPTAGELIGHRDNPAAGAPSTADAPGVKLEKRLGGEDYYLQAGLNEKMETLKSDRPHQNTEAFIERLERRIIRALSWFYELLDPSAIGGASVRMIQDQARLSVLKKQASMKRRALRCVRFALGQAMKAAIIPENNDGGDFLKWDFTLPAQLTVDQGYDEQADRDNLLMGTTTKSIVCGKKGRHWEDNDKQRLIENFALVNNALQLVEYAKANGKGEKLTLREALDMMQRDGVAQRLEVGADAEPSRKQKQKAAA